MSFAGQLKVASAQMQLRLDHCDKELSKFAMLAAQAFESATSVLFEARSKEDSRQFIGHVCFLETSLRMIRELEPSKQLLKHWPNNLTTFGRYHRSHRSSVELAVSFAKGIYAEVANARLKAYPNQSIDGRELDELTEWRNRLRAELTEMRPELIEWPAWQLHQDRRKILESINQELSIAFGNAGDIRRSEAVNRLAKRDVSGGESENQTRWKTLADVSIIGMTKDSMINFFRHWQARPREFDSFEFNNYFLGDSASSHFEQEFDDVLWLVRRSIRIGEALSSSMSSTRLLSEMLGVYDIEAASGERHKVRSELTQVLEILGKCVAVNGKKKKRESKGTTPVGRKPKPITPEEQQILDMWATNRYRYHADIDQELELTYGTTKKTLKNLSNRPSLKGETINTTNSAD